VSERIIETVITNQFTTAFQATSHHNEIEISGFGKFLFLQVKARKQMNKYLAQKQMYETMLLTDDTPEKVRNTQLRLKTTLKNIEHLKPKLHEPKPDIRGVEESLNP
jgi:hypothetical protein